MKEKIIIHFQGLSKSTADTFGWLSVIILNCATIPSFLAVMAGVTDRMPPFDIVLLLWTALLFYFIKSAILKDMLMVITIGIGFAVQAMLLGAIFFV